MVDKVKLTSPVSRSYGEFCGVARALDLVGDRWTLLIVRELLIRPSRYSELLAGLPGVATNLLAERLRSLEVAGILERVVAASSNSLLYQLTPWGSELREPVEALIRWSAPLMATGPRDDVFQAHWLAIALSALLHGRRATAPLALALESAGESFTISVDAEHANVTLGRDERATTVFQADPRVLLCLAVGKMSVDQALAAGTLVGERGVLDAIFDAEASTVARAEGGGSPSSDSQQ